MLKELHLKHVGPAERFDVEFGDRLNIFTGDNGLGKSFLLDVSWWALTNNWSDHPAFPRSHSKESPEISYAITTSDGEVESIGSKFDASRQTWKANYRRREKHSYLSVYARAEGGFSVWDPTRPRSLARSDYNFTPDTLWNGLKAKNRGNVLCNGLIQDWVTWQNQSDRTTFDLLFRVIRQLFHPDEAIEPAEPTRVFLNDVRDIPTIQLPYERLPITHASSGIKRILGLAYILVWTWYEHLKAAELRNEKPLNQLILLMDEVELHLHPQWQRSILPSVLEVISGLQKQMQVQAIATTHAPLVLASIEPLFDEQNDKLFLFELNEQEVNLAEVPWSKQGDTVGWLTSEVFGLKQARSKEAEVAIEAAEAYMRRDDLSQFPENLQHRDQIHQELQRTLPGHDPFWPRWIVTAGVVEV